MGHVEWVEFVHADHVPAAGEIVHASHAFEEPAGGGSPADRTSESSCWPHCRQKR